MSYFETVDRLKKIRNAPGGVLTEPTKPGCVGFVSTSGGPSENSAGHEGSDDCIRAEPPQNRDCGSTGTDKTHKVHHESLDAILAEACYRCHFDAAEIKAELVETGDWPDMTPALLRCYLQCLAHDIRRLPLAAKLRAYGKPWPLKVDGRTVAWLVPDEDAKQSRRGQEPCYSAREVEVLADMPAEESKALCAWKAHFGGEIHEVKE